MKEDINNALKFDPLAFAEKVTGCSYKEDDSTAKLGMGLAMEHNKLKGDLLKGNNDTFFGGSLEYQMGVMFDMGFKIVLEDHIPETEDKCYILWRDGVVIFFDTYGGSLNGGKAYFNFKGPRESLDGCSNGFITEDEDGEPIWQGDYDIREGLRNLLNKLEETGKLLPTWTEKPFLWFLHYKDTKVEVYDYKAITAERISRLPKEIQNAIKGNSEK